MTAARPNTIHAIDPEPVHADSASKPVLVPILDKRTAYFAYGSYAQPRPGKPRLIAPALLAPNRPRVIQTAKPKARSAGAQS